MGINKHERFENHMDVSSPETMEDAEKIETFSEDAYDDLFDKRLSSFDTLECKTSNKTFTLPDMKLSEHNNLQDDKEVDNEHKRKISNKTSPHSEKFIMDSRATLEYKIEHTDESKRENFVKELETSAVGGIDGHRAHLTGTGEEFYVMHSEDQLASGRFSVKDHPDDDIQKRREDVQAYFENDCSVVDKVHTTKPVVSFESKVAPQPDWAQKANYTARYGGTQTYIPLINGKRPIEEGVLSISKEDEENTEK